MPDQMVPAPARDVGHSPVGAARTDEVEFSPGGSLSWGAWPAESLALAPGGQPLAHAGLVCPGAGVTIAGEQHELAVTWRAHHDGLFLARAVNRMSGRPGPGGATRWSWEHLESFWYASRTVPARTVGVVPTVVRPPGATAPARPSLRLPYESRTAPAALDVLPVPVQAGLLRLVREPTLWLGDLSQHITNYRIPWRQSVELFRMDADRAVVVSATRGCPPAEGGLAPEARPPKDPERVLNTLPWTVTQLVYDLTPGQNVLAASGGHLQIAGA